MEAPKRIVYILKNTDDPPRFYTGVTGDLRARLEAHNAERCPHTAKHRPWLIDAVIKFADERRAVALEKYLKSGSGVEFARRQAVERQQNAWTTLALARAQALSGDPAIAASTMARIDKQGSRFVSGYDRAAVHAALGQTDEAFTALEEGYQARAEWMGYLKVDPQMDNLRSDARFATFLRRLNF